MFTITKYMKQILLTLLVLLGLLCLACEDTGNIAPRKEGNGVAQIDTGKTDEENNNSGDADTDGDGDGDGDTDSDGDTDGDGDTSGSEGSKNDSDDERGEDDPDKTSQQIDDGSCAEQGFKVERSIVRLIILLDASGSMGQNQKWANAKKAIRATLEKYDYMLDIGFDTFPDSIGNVIFSMGAMCGVNGPMLVDCAQENGKKIEARMNSIIIAANSGAMTPLGCAMKKFTQEKYAPGCTDRAFPTYLLVISDGVDTCGLDCSNPSGNGQPGGMKMVAGEQYKDITKELLDIGIKTFVVGFGQGADPADLNAIASSGGTTVTKYIDAQDGESLQKALDKIASSVVSCSFQIGEQDKTKVDLDKTNLYSFDKDDNRKVIGWDQNCSKNKGGWTWANDQRSAIDLCEKTCQQLKDGTIRGITATFGCPPVIIV